MQAVIESLKGTTFLILGFFWMFGGMIGAIYWAINSEILNVVLSIFLPGYGAISTIADLVF